MLYTKKSKGQDRHPDGHTRGERPKKQSQGTKNRKSGSFKRSKAYRGQGKA
jgi:hypothetical protein